MRATDIPCAQSPRGFYTSLTPPTARQSSYNLAGHTGLSFLIDSPSHTVRGAPGGGYSLTECWGQGALCRPRARTLGSTGRLSGGVMLVFSLGRGRGGLDHKHPLLKPTEGFRGNKTKALSFLKRFKRKQDTLHKVSVVGGRDGRASRSPHVGCVTAQGPAWTREPAQWVWLVGDDPVAQVLG